MLISLMLTSMLTSTLSGCLKQAQIPQAAAPTPVAVGAVMEYLDAETVEAVPDALSSAVGDALTARNLPPTLVDAASWSDARNSQLRLQQLGEASDAELLLLLETHAEFFSQLSGQFRWTVSVRATVATSVDLEGAVVEEFEVPVFLFNYNEREREALEAATPTIERKVGGLVEQFLGL